ncbi:MAG: hypothetical protein DDT29_02542 [Dehalococcoidia bacterium]|nr:hypothetical protein [Bacillota bacterium]
MRGNRGCPLSAGTRHHAEKERQPDNCDAAGRNTDGLAGIQAGSDSDFRQCSGFDSSAGPAAGTGNRCGLFQFWRASAGDGSIDSFEEYLYAPGSICGVAGSREEAKFRAVHRSLEDSKPESGALLATENRGDSTRQFACLPRKAT